MPVTKIIFKNVKSFLLNPFFIAFLVLIPIFQIALISGIINSAMKDTSSFRFVEIITTQKTFNNAMVENISIGIVVQFILLTGVIASSALVVEKEKHTLLRMYTAPISNITIISGFVIGNTIICSAITSVIIIISSLTVKIHWGNMLNIAIIVVISSFLSGAFSLFISGLFKNSKVITGVMSVVIIMMTIISGGLFPIEGLGVLPYFTLNKWISDAFTNSIQNNGLSGIAVNLIGMSAITLVFIIASALIYRRENS